MNTTLLVKRNSFVERPKPDNDNFLRLNNTTIVVTQVDELRPILKMSDCDNIENDACLLLNSRRLDFADPKVVVDIIRNRFASRNVQSPFEGLTDEEIFSTIKSRNMQSLSELDNFAEYLANTIGQNLLSADDKTLPVDEPKNELVSE